MHNQYKTLLSTGVPFALLSSVIQVDTRALRRGTRRVKDSELLVVAKLLLASLCHWHCTTRMAGAKITISPDLLRMLSSV